MLLMARIFLFLLSPVLGFYTEEAPAKFLSVQSIASRFPASASSYRESLENGYDEDSGRTEGETLNDFPEMRLMLNPGGCGFYKFPFKQDQEFAYIQPGRKQGNLYEDYCDKAPVNVEVSSVDVPDPDTEIRVKLCTNTDTSHLGSIWEINF